MNDDFVTLEVFANPLEATVAKNCLEDAGISAFLVSENLVSMASVLGNAVGGVRLEVGARDLAQAHAILEGARRRRTDAAGKSQFQADVERGPEEVDEIELPPSSREHEADRALKAAILGLILLPLQVYVSWLLLKVYFSEEPLRKRHALGALLAGAINAPFVIIACFWLWILVVNVLNL